MRPAEPAAPTGFYQILNNLVILTFHSYNIIF